MRASGAARGLLHASALLCAVLVSLPAPPVSAEVGPDAWYFEIDGDYGSAIEPESVASQNYTLPSRAVTDGEGANRNTTYAPKGGYRIGADEPACTSWYHVSGATYMGAQAYRVQCPHDGRLSQDPDADEEKRRSEQMLLSAWYTGIDSARYFTLAFRFQTIGTLPAESGGYIAQWHHGSSQPPAVMLAWSYQDGSYFLRSGVYRDSPTDERIYTPLFFTPASPGVWYRMLFRVDPGLPWGWPGCEQCPGGQGSVRAWLLNATTGEWEPWGAEYQGQLGYRYMWDPKRFRSGEDQLSYQWKVGHYASEIGYVSLDYDNVAYGKRWNTITRDRLVGYRKNVLRLEFDEAQGSGASDTSWTRNGGLQGDATADYDNDGSLVGSVSRSSDGVGSPRRSLSFYGGYVNVPIDRTDFDFGNYVSVSAWFKTSASAVQPQGLVSIDADGGAGKLFLARADDRLSFGVRHPDGTYSQVIYNHAPALYADGKWHHLVGTFNRFPGDNRRVKLYVDGTRVLQREGYDKPILRGDTRLAVGRLAGSGSFSGSIDEVELMNYALSDAEVAVLSGKAVPTSAAVP
jgi:hypothetical protein